MVLGPTLGVQPWQLVYKPTSLAEHVPVCHGSNERADAPGLSWKHKQLVGSELEAEARLPGGWIQAGASLLGSVSGSQAPPWSWGIEGEGVVLVFFLLTCPAQRGLGKKADS